MGLFAGSANVVPAQASGVPGRGEFVGDLAEVLYPPGGLDQLPRAGVEAADGLGDLGEVANTIGRNGLADGRGVPHVDALERGGTHGPAELAELVAQVLVEGGDPVVVEGRCTGAEDRRLMWLLAEGLAVADHLPADVA